MSASLGNPPAVISPARVNVQYDSFAFVAVDMVVARLCGKCKVADMFTRASELRVASGRLLRKVLERYDDGNGLWMVGSDVRHFFFPRNKIITCILTSKLRKSLWDVLGLSVIFYFSLSVRGVHSNMDRVPWYLKPLE